MSNLSRIEAKLDELVKAKKAEQTEKQPTQEEKDEERMREIEERITDLIDLLNTGTTRESADAKIEEHRERVKSGKGEPRPLLKVYHEHKGKKIPTTRRTQVSLCTLPNLFLFIEITVVIFIWLYHNSSMPDAHMNLIFIMFVMPHVFLVLFSWLTLHLLLYSWLYALKHVFRVAAE